MLVETAFHIIASNRVADVSTWTEALGITPHATARMGESRGAQPSPDSWWALILDKREASSAEVPLVELLADLAPRAAAIATLAAAENLDLSVTTYVWESDQGLVVDLSPAVLRTLARLGCSYSVVAYD